MDELNLPAFNHQLKKDEGVQLIYDAHRKKYVVLTPEEWVRQHFLNYLISYLNYPKSLIKIESGVHINKMSKRSDILVYDRKAAPYMLVECKSTQVPLTQAVFDQVSTYNKAYQAKYLVITNGKQHYCCELDYDTKQYQFLNRIPNFD